MTPVDVVRDENGEFYHPELLELYNNYASEGAEYIPSSHWELWCSIHGIMTHYVEMVDDDPDLFKKIAEECDPSYIVDWNPKPLFEGDFLIAIADYESGPLAIFAKNVK